MQNIMPYKSTFDIGNPGGRLLGGNNETGSLWGGWSYRAHMLFVAQSICMQSVNSTNPAILWNREGTG